MPARVLGGIARSSQSAIPVLRAAQCDVAIGSHITYSRASSGTRYNSAGTLVTMASGVPCIDYDPVSLACLGLLVSAQFTNVLTYSEQRDNADWVLGGTSTVAANSATAPTGTAVADKLVEAANNGFHYAYQGRTVTAGSTVVYSEFAKAAERSWFNLQVFNGVTYPRAFFNLSTGAIGVSADGATPYIKAVGGGWYRCAVAYVSAGTSAFVHALTATGDNVLSYTGDGTSGINLFGAQLNEGELASYIPTTSAGATRAADDATITGDAFAAIYNAAAWGAYLRFSLPFAIGTRPVLSFDDGTADNRIEVYASGTSLKLRVVTGGAQQCDTTIGTVAANTDYKLAISQDGGAFLATLNGAAEVSATAASMPTVDRARLGRNQAGNYLNGHLHTWDAYRRALPVRERLELTT